MTRLATITTLAAAALALGLALHATTARAAEASLYDRIGGAVVMQRVTEDMVARVAGDPRVNQSFRGINVHSLSSKLATHLCAMTGGKECSLSEDSVRTIHAGLKITESEFYALVDSLRIALDENGVGDREKNELLRILAPFKRDVVTQ